MIFELLDAEKPIRQGDIFRSIPHLSYDPERIISVVEEKIKPPTSLLDLIEEYPSNQNMRVLVRLKYSYGIIVSQDCDVARDDTITFFEIDEFFAVTGLTLPPDPSKHLKWWAEQLPQKARTAQKWFYLPVDEQLGFSQRMAVDFGSVITVPTNFIVNNLSKLRVGRLNFEADEHFREQVAQYFRRYPYDEWYPLTKEEYEIYIKQPYRDMSNPRDYQK